MQMACVDMPRETFVDVSVPTFLVSASVTQIQDLGKLLSVFGKIEPESWTGNEISSRPTINGWVLCQGVSSLGFWSTKPT